MYIQVHEIKRIKASEGKCHGSGLYLLHRGIFWPDAEIFIDSALVVDGTRNGGPHFTLGLNWAGGLGRGL